MVKRRVMPEDVIINCSKDSECPKPPPGRKWKEVRHDNTVTAIYIFLVTRFWSGINVVRDDTRSIFPLTTRPNCINSNSSSPRSEKDLTQPNLT